MINEETLGMMKMGVTIVNVGELESLANICFRADPCTARGPLIDEVALVRAIESGRGELEDSRENPVLQLRSGAGGA